MTLDTYSHVLPDTQAQVADKLDSIFLPLFANKNKENKNPLQTYYLQGVYLVRLTGVEPATSGFEVRNSIQLSYRRILMLIIKQL